jgi:hypothetical protein
MREKSIASASKVSGVGVRIRPARVTNREPQIAEFYPQNAPFLIDIWRLEIVVTHSKHSMGARSNRHRCGSLQIGVSARAAIVAKDDRAKDSER